MTPSDAQITEAVLGFRAAIDAAGQQLWANQGLAFPRGACGHAAELLGQYLIQKFDIAPEYVNQWAYDDIGGWTDSHAWLEWNGLTIDITGDQFGWDPVIVTREPTFHGSGEPAERHPVCLPHQADWWARNCSALWGVISAHLPK
jgi:hypothetical protein